MAAPIALPRLSEETALPALLLICAMIFSTTSPGDAPPLSLPISFRWMAGNGAVMVLPFRKVALTLTLPSRI